MFSDGLTMRLGRIPFMLKKIILWIPIMVRGHQTIAGYLGNNGGSGNGRTPGLPLDQRLLRQIQGNGEGAVDQQKIGLTGKAA